VNELCKIETKEDFSLVTLGQSAQSGNLGSIQIQGLQGLSRVTGSWSIHGAFRSTHSWDNWDRDNKGQVVMFASKSLDPLLTGISRIAEELTHFD